MKRLGIVAALVSAVFLSGVANAADANPRVAIDTTKGRIVVELEGLLAPLTVANFLAYVDSGFYAETVFHRVIQGFMIQGGGFTADLQKKPTEAPIQNEAKDGLKNVRGTIAMARTNRPHSATAQFFINTVDNAALDHPGSDGWGYVAFGRVVEGMDVVDAIAAVATGRVGPMADVPTEPVVIESASRLE